MKDKEHVLRATCNQITSILFFDHTKSAICEYEMFSYESESSTYKGERFFTPIQRLYGDMLIRAVVSVLHRLPGRADEQSRPVQYYY
jgi:hypothetical protein